jgi:hypothetical protein
LHPLAGLALVALITLVGCGSSVPRPRLDVNDARAPNPLGPSYVLLPAPADEAGMLGRMLEAPPAPGRALEEIARPNPCAEHLEPARESAQASSFENAEELTVSAGARATLGMFGFSVDLERATHFLYRLRTSRRVQRADTTAYVQCCQTQACGYGFVSALIYGEGEYATGEEAHGKGGVDVAFASGGGAVALKVLSRRQVRGFVAALVTVTAKDRGPALGALGVPASEVNLSTTTEAYRQMYDKHRIRVCSDPVKTEWSFCDVRGSVTENEFVRRYALETKSDELDDVEHNRELGWLLLKWGPLAVGVPAMITTFALAATAPDDPSGEPHPATYFLMPSGLVLAVGVSNAIVINYERDGTPHDHSLTESDGRLYADRYNRALLRRVQRDAQRGAPVAEVEPPIRRPAPRNRLVLTPMVGPITGIAGTFE